METQLNTAIQENVLTLLVYDKKAIATIINNVTVQTFDSSIYQQIATKAINFYKQFKEPIGIHLHDELQDTLTGKNKALIKLYEDTLYCLDENKDNVNVDYTLKQLNAFIRRQTLQTSIIEAAELIQSNKVDEAEKVLNTCQKKQVKIFDIGTQFSDCTKSLAFLDEHVEVIPTGIKQLDDYQICPAPKELYTLAGLSNRGKTWFLIHVAKFALLTRKKVLHVSLEMSEIKLSERYNQNLFSFTKYPADFHSIAKIRKDKNGLFQEISYKEVKPKGSFLDNNIRQKLKKKIRAFASENLVIKEFPTSALTITKLRGYLENLINFYKFMPDIILVDDPDNMQLDAKNLRLEISAIYKELRGLAVEYNLAVVVVSQINRKGVTASWINEQYLSEDFTKLFISDVLLTYNQTEQEREFNLGRLYVVKNRGGIKGQKILITQNYDTGQFCLDSVLMKGNKYWNVLSTSKQDE